MAAETSSSQEVATPQQTQKATPKGRHDELTDEQVQEVFDALEQKRQEWADDVVGYDGDFNITLTGGPAVMREHGLAFQAFKGLVRQGSPAELWCGQHGLAKSASFSLAMYGEQTARIMAHAWCHRMHYFYSLWVAADDPSFRYTDEDVAAYAEQPAFSDLASGLEGAQLARANKIRALRPL